MPRVAPNIKGVPQAYDSKKEKKNTITSRTISNIVLLVKGKKNHLYKQHNHSADKLLTIARSVEIVVQI